MPFRRPEPGYTPTWDRPASDDVDHQMQVGVAQATEQVRELMQADVPGIHFYVLNKSAATSCVLDNLMPAR